MSMASFLKSLGFYGKPVRGKKVGSESVKSYGFNPAAEQK